MAKCETPNCPYQACSGEKLCLQHRPKRVPDPSSPFNTDGFLYVSVKDVPATGRLNEGAMNLVAALRVLPDGQAIKLNLNKFQKATLVTAQRYARQATNGFRVGVRFSGSTGYLWKLSADEIARAEAKGERMRKVRANKVKAIKKTA